MTKSIQNMPLATAFCLTDLRYKIVKSMDAISYIGVLQCLGEVTSPRESENFTNMQTWLCINFRILDNIEEHVFYLKRLLKLESSAFVIPQNTKLLTIQSRKSCLNSRPEIELNLYRANWPNHKILCEIATAHEL